MKTISACVVSDRLKHDTNAVFAFKSLMIEEIRRRNIPLQHIHYFSDGCSAQYENCKNLLDLCHHEQDFGLTADWSFFASSHGKWAYDGIGAYLNG